MYIHEGSAGRPGIYADLSQATAATINQLREAFQIQKLYERDARGGTRYTEIIRSHFGVVSPDARLQRAEYLGGGKDRINVNPIAQTSSTDSTTPQGNMSAYATTGFSGHGFNKSFTEHSVIIGMACVFADLNYQQGLNRMWSRQDRWDFYWPALAHIGEQAVLNKEIYAQGTSDDDGVFGYQERFAEYLREECDIKTIIKQHDRTGIIQHVARGVAEYGDYSEVHEYREALDLINHADESFAGLPSDVRKMFNNDAARFMKRLRKKYGSQVRFFHCGEYGDLNKRPHYHAILFGVDFAHDRKLWSQKDGMKLFTSESLEKLWPYGFCTIGQVTFESCAYVARYIMKKQTGEKAVSKK